LNTDQVQAVEFGPQRVRLRDAGRFDRAADEFHCHPFGSVGEFR
jgi:hypothetical protein